MESNRLPEFIEIWNNKKVALIDPENKVCLSVNKWVIENLNIKEVREKIYSIWKKEAEFQKIMEEQREKINTVYLMITRKCNMNCNFCAIDANNNLHMEKEITIEDIQKKIAPFLHKNCPHKLIITGGEPLIKPQIVEIVRVLHAKVKCPIIIQSNGLAINQNIVNGIKENISEIDFSTKHMIGDIKKENELKRHIEICQNAGIKVVLSFIYERENKRELYKVIDIAAEYDVSLLIDTVSSVGRAKGNVESLSDLEKINMHLDIAKYIWKMKYEDKALFRVVQEPIRVIDSCGGYGRVMAIFPEGNIYMCQCAEEERFKLGNILENSFEHIMSESEKFLQKKYIKEYFCVRHKKICNECNYAFLCGGKCLLSADTDYKCYFIKKIIDYRLFYREKNTTNRKILKGYIQYLEKVRNECQ